MEVQGSRHQLVVVYIERKTTSAASGEMVSHIGPLKVLVFYLFGQQYLCRDDSRSHFIIGYVSSPKCIEISYMSTQQVQEKQRTNTHCPTVQNVNSSKVDK